MSKIRYAQDAKKRLAFSVSGMPGWWARKQYVCLAAGLVANFFVVSAWYSGPNGDATMGLATAAHAKSHSESAMPEFRKVPNDELIEMQQIDAVSLRVSKNFRIAKEAARAIVIDVWTVSKRKNLNPMTVIAIIGVESRFNPLAESVVGAQGLGQVLGKAHPEKIARVRAREGHILSVKDNIEELTNVYSDCLAHFKGDEKKALLYYNGSLNDRSAAYANLIYSMRDRLSGKTA